MHKAFHCLFLVALFWSGKVHAQNSETDSLINLLSQSADDTNKVNLLRNIGNNLANQDPRTAITYWQQGVVLSYKLNYIKGLARNYINIGTGYSFLSKMDSTIIYADSGIKYSKIIGDPDRLALVYLNKADGYRNLGNFKAALLYCDTASNYAASNNNTDRQARIYDIISSIYAEQQQFYSALEIQKKALALYQKDNNGIMEGQVYDDFGLLYQQMGKPDSALYYYKQAVALGERHKDYKNLSTYYFSLAQLYAEQNNYSQAETHAAQSLRHAKEQENNNHIAAAYSLLGRIYLKQRKYTEAIKAGTIAYDYAMDEVLIEQQQDVAALLAQAYRGIGDQKNAYHYLEISTNLKDSIVKQQYDEQVANLQSSFELKEKDKEILLLEKGGELQQQKLQQQRLLMTGSIGLAILALAGIWLVMNRNKLRQQMKEMELRNRIAADLHDEVGSSLSSIHMLSQIATQQPGSDTRQQDILSRMSTNAKETMEKMGDIVWMIKPGESEGANLKQRIERFAYEICSSKNIRITLELEQLEKVKLSMDQRKNFYLVFKEALNNAVKYSGTEAIEIIVSSQHKQLTLQVIDHGQGFEPETTGRGNGLDNMKNRAKELGAQLEIDSATGVGTIVMLELPV